MPALRFSTALPLRTRSGWIEAATSMRALGSIAKVRSWMPCPSMFWISVARRGLVDRVHRDAVLAAREHLLAVEIHHPRRAVGEIDEPPVGVHVDRARHPAGTAPPGC